MSVVIETTLGDITVDLYLKERPNACLNFLKLCKVKYYNLCIFHKVERNFIAQTGDPTSTGRGGESIFCRLYGEQAKYFDAELKPRLKHEKLGTLSMVTNSNNMNGSQFFITLGENVTYLDEVHTVFGEVAEGFDVLLKINEAICDPDNRPYQDIRITHTVVLHDPYDDPSGLEIPDASPIPTREQLESNYIGADEEIDDTKGKTVEEVEEKIKDSEAKARATILEMVGDLPDADVKPPENVLFVCKLNPVTTSEDLEIIFSRFGQIVSCEVIKDKKTGESLQYAFIEFEKEEDCENAYFKMDNVLIDDRRIHVDFSQSVSKLNNSQNDYSQQTTGRFKNFLIKDKQRKSDGYEMVFDMEQETSRTDKHQRSLKRKHSSPDHRSHKSHHKKSSREMYKERERHSKSSSSDKYSSHHKSSKSSRSYQEAQSCRDERNYKKDYYSERSYKKDHNEDRNYEKDYKDKSYKKDRNEHGKYEKDYKDKSSKKDHNEHRNHEKDYKDKSYKKDREHRNYEKEYKDKSYKKVR